eukprot:Skav216027  [mRNA]  locus=scaffold417:129842:131179:+ [translate_table: standard]
MPATGHMNPTLPLATELVARGVQVSYFVDEKVRSVVEATGAKWYQLENPMIPNEELIAKYMPGMPKEETGFPMALLPYAASTLPKLIKDLQTLQPAPSIILYDPFLPFARIAARQMGIPCVGTVTLTGPGVIEVPSIVREQWESNPGVQKANQELKDNYNFDVFEHGTFLEFYSPDQNIVCTSDSLYVAPQTPVQLERFPHFPFQCVGPLLNTKIQRLHNANVSSQSVQLPAAVDDALAAGKRLLYISPGTVATEHFWTEPFGPQAHQNGLSDSTGKEFVQMLFRVAIEALGNDPDIQVVLSTGPKEDALEGISLPENFIAQAVLPQLELLQKCHAFITHGGANSMHEALSFGVPLAVVPIFGDQPANADVVASAGAGVSFRYPKETLTVPALKEAVHKLIQEEGPFHEGVQKVQKELLNAGGVSKAADLVLATAHTLSSKLGGA